MMMLNCIVHARLCNNHSTSRIQGLLRNRIFGLSSTAITTTTTNAITTTTITNRVGYGKNDTVGHGGIAGIATTTATATRITTTTTTTVGLGIKQDDIKVPAKKLNISSSTEVEAAASVSSSSSTITQYPTTTTTIDKHKQMLPLPSNLFLDPQSSFATTNDRYYYNYNPKKQVTTNNNNNNRQRNTKGNPNSNTNNNNNNVPSEINLINDTVVVSDLETDIDQYNNNDTDFQYDPASGPIVYAKPLPERLNVQVYTLLAPQYDNVVGTLWLDSTVFGCDPIRVDILKRAVDHIRNQKRGIRTAHTKTISEVRGSGKKIRNQKGTGMARAGHRRPPHFRGGAKAHGPNKHNNTDYSNCKLNKKVMSLAIRTAISQKLKEGNLLLFNDFTTLPTHKTKDLVRLFKPWNIATGTKDSDTALIIDYYYPTDTTNTTTDTDSTSSGNDADNDKKSSLSKSTSAAVPPASYKGVPINLYVASTNLYQMKVGNALHNLNVYDILKYNKLILTLAAVQHIESRLHVD